MWVVVLVIYLFLLSEGNFILLYLFVGKCEFLRVLFVLNLLKKNVVLFPPQMLNCPKGY